MNQNNNKLNFIITTDNTRHYKVNGEYHREDGPAIEWGNGNKHWYLNGKLHRLDGPAIDNLDGFKIWYKNGLMHRLDGPAYCPHGYWLHQWWIDGKQIHCKTNEEFLKIVKLKLFW